VKLVLLRVASTIAGDVSMAAGDTAPPTDVTATKFALLFAGITYGGKTMPVGMETVHAEPAASVAVFAVRMSALVAPDPVVDGIAVVVPQPEYVGVPKVPRL